MPVDFGSYAGMAAGATGGASIPIEALLTIFGMGGLSSIFGSKDSPRDEAIAYALDRIKKEMPWLKQLPYSKGEVEGKVDEMSQTARGAANVAAGQIGASLAESLPAAGVPKGQPSGSIYTSEMAPVIAQGERDAIGVEQWGMDLFSKMDSESKNRIISSLGLLTGTAGQQPDMTKDQKAIATFLQSINLFSSAYGNLAKGYKDFNWKPITP